MFDAATKKCASYRMGKGSSGRCNDLEGAGCDKCGETTKQREKGGDESDRCAHGMKMRSGRDEERKKDALGWGERARTRQLPTRPKTAIKRVGKQTTFPFCRSRSGLTIIGIHLRVISANTRDEDRLPFYNHRSFFRTIAFFAGVRLSLISTEEGSCADTQHTRPFFAFGRFDRIFQGAVCRCAENQPTPAILQPLVSSLKQPYTGLFDYKIIPLADTSRHIAIPSSFLFVHRSGAFYRFTPSGDGYGGTSDEWLWSRCLILARFAGRHGKMERLGEKLERLVEIRLGNLRWINTSINSVLINFLILIDFKKF